MRETTAWAVLLAAGSGTRLAKAGIGVKKQFLDLGGRPLFWASAATFAACGKVAGVVFVFPPDELDASAALVGELDRGACLGLPWKIAAGGARRQDSVRNGLAALPQDAGRVLVHDSARPFASAALTLSLLESLNNGARAAIPALPVTDTIKRGDGRSVSETLRRSELFAAQTPQAFELPLLREAHKRAEAEGWEVTDDASMVERLGESVALVEGEAGNIKITNPEDLRLVEQHCKRLEPAMEKIPVTGFGYDVHRYAHAAVNAKQPPRPMVLGGVPIPGAPEVLAHSDGDVLLHALTDAVLGCMGAGDIGSHFPDTDPAFDGASSALLLARVLDQARDAGVTIRHADLTVIAQTPRLSPHRETIRKNVAAMLGLDPAFVNVKATTEEGLGFTGEKKGIKAVAVVTALR